MQKNNAKAWWVGFIGTIIILGAFAIAALVLSNVGIRVYQNVVIANNENFELRTSLSYVATRVRQKDTADSVRIEEINGVPTLVLSYQADTGYTNETLIYYYDGYLREHIRMAGDAFDLSYGFEMIEVSDFKMQLEGSLLTMTAVNKAGESDSLSIALRTRQ